MSAIVETDLVRLLESHEGNYADAYKQLVADEQARALANASRSTVESRKSAWKVAVAKLDRQRLSKASTLLGKYVANVRRNAEITASDPHVLDTGEAYDLMAELLDVKSIKEFVDARYEEIRRTVFASMTEDFAKQGEEYPEHVSGSIEVPELGKRFAREGTGRKDPQLDEDKLRKLLGDELWNQVTIEEVIPEQRVRKLDIDLLMQKARRAPSILEHLRSALKVGDWKSPRFVVRDIPAEG